MQTSEAEDRLKAMLAVAGFDIKDPNPQIAWNVFKLFTQEPVVCADDGVLFQCGLFLSSGLFYLDFVRQFELENEDGEYDHMEQLHCEFTCKPNKQLHELGKNLWAYDFESLNEYFAAVENLAEFKTAISQTGWQCKIRQEEV